MKKFWEGKEKEILIGILFTIIISTSLFFLINMVFKQQTGVQTAVYPKQVCLNSSCFDVEIAKTPIDRQLGLMGRGELEKDKGMLFVFEEEGINGFWMKNTLISLDIIWINSVGNIVYIKENAMPCIDEKNVESDEEKANSCPIIVPNKEALYVLEINAGMIKEINVSLGDKVDFRY